LKAGLGDGGIRVGGIVVHGDLAALRIAQVKQLSF
jgi:hypothetical protein